MAKKVILGTDIARDAFKTKINDNFTELYDKDVALGESINSLTTEVVAHKAEKVSQRLTITRDISITGQQVITTLANREIKSIVISSYIDGTAIECFSLYSKSEGLISKYKDGTNYTNGFVSGIIFSKDARANRVAGTVTVNTGNITIDWTVLSGTGVPGTARVNFLIQYHD